MGEIRTSSAGNTRGLIEAASSACAPAAGQRLPRGIPAASLKHLFAGRSSAGLRRLPRGIPAASLKQEHLHGLGVLRQRLPRGIPAASLKPGGPSLRKLSEEPSSAGNTRGLIEAEMDVRTTSTAACMSSAGNTRGLIEAGSRHAMYGSPPRVFRGEYPRPH